MTSKIKKTNIAILGDGAWATTLAILLSKNGHKVTMWSAFGEHLEELEKERENWKYLPGIRIPGKIVFEKDIGQAIESSEMVVFAIPSKFFREVAQKIRLSKAALKGKVFINVAKGLEQKTLKRMTEVIRDELGNVQVAVLSGPSIAIEVAQGLPALVVAAAKDHDTAVRIQNIFSNDYFRVYTSTDIVGVELGGPLKNIIAVVAGISDGLGFGSNAKAAILSRGLAEIQRLGAAMGAKSKTFIGLAGLGDLSTTCISPESRNRTFGERIAKGEKMDEIVRSTASIIEGATTAEAVYQLSKRYKVDMPITGELYRILYKNKSPQKAIKDLMGRKKKPE
jgi:glycerol-3-phosphate dehydrogenase (NAD(P)+)